MITLAQYSKERTRLSIGCTPLMHHSTVFCFLRILILLLLESTFFYANGQVAIPTDTVKNVAKDSSKTANIEALKAQSDLKATIDYSSNAYMVLDMELKTLKLISKGKIDYEKMSLSADTIIMNWENDLLSAKGTMDSTGHLTGRPEFEENGQKYRSDSMLYNIATQKGLVFGARTQQDDNYILADRVKKTTGETYYVKNGKFTTCDAEHPHYYIKSKKLKIIPRDKIITGPLLLVIEDFPLPIIIPFGFFPNQTKRSSGVVMPTYGEATDRGFFLRDGGYYFAISDKMDLLIKGDIFSKGGWRLDGSTSYNKRYKFNGKFGLEYGIQKFGEKEDPTFRETREFWVRWNHSQTLTPQATLRANVSAGTSTYNQNFSYDAQNYLSNTFISSVNFNQSFANSPWRMSINGNHSQNTNTGQVTLGLPDLTVNRTRWFPFRKAGGTGDKWFKKIGASYTMSLRNQISVPDSLLGRILTQPNQLFELTTINGEDTTSEFKRGLDYYKNGILHSIPITSQVTLAKYINISPSINFREYWYIKTIEQNFVDSTQSIVSDDVYGFSATRSFDASVAASTRVYGIYQFNNKKKTAFRHTFQPSIGYSHKPDFGNDFWNVYREVQTDSIGNTTLYSKYQGALFGGPTAGAIQAITFSLNNILELKYKDPAMEADSTAKDKYKRLNILDSFGARSSYNLAADSLNLSLITLNARTSMFNNKLAIQLNGSVDPYTVTAEGARINTYLIQSEGKLGRLSNMTLAFSTSLRSGRNDAGGRNAVLDVDQPNHVRRPRNITEAEWDQIQFFRDAYVDFSIPWSLNINSNIRYSNNGIKKDTTVTLNFSGDVNISPKWKIGYTSGWDFSAKDFSYTSFTIFRDLHCWEMSLNWIPFGNRQSFNFAINVKSPTLKDLKLTKRRDWQDRFR